MAPSVLTDEKTDDQNYDQNGSVEIGYTTGPEDKIAEIKKANGVKNKQKVVEVADDTTYGYKTSAPGGPKSKGAANIRTYSDDPSLKKFPRISRPVELMRTSYDVVVVGSGYGGGVAASRMARGKKSVCLLELGKEKWPGEYPYKLKDAMNELHVSGEFAPGRMTGAMVEGGDPTGLYHLVVGKGQNAFMANGLGGTSLLNANVFLEADQRTLQLDEWPKELRDDKDALKPHYERARQVLQPNPYPKDWPELPKLNMLEKQAEALGLGDCFYRVPQTTRFVDGPNSTGVEMQASALTGMDCTGINDGSKGSTLVNYLSDAWNWGAELFCETEVRYVKKAPNGDGYHVYFAWHGNKRAKFRGAFYEDLMWVHAKECVFLGAGAIGTTEILLRSKERGLPMSNKVGTGMSGNGDILAFGYNNTSKVHSIGREFPSPERPIGPTITGVIDCRDNAVNVLDGFVIEEGAVPEALSKVFQAMLELMPGKIYTPGLTPLEQVRKTLARAGSRILGPYYRHGSIERTQTYLIMSHDSNQATLTLKKGKPVLQFEGVGRSAHVQHLNNVLAQATAATGGTFVNSPFYSLLGQQEITVHAIGGACMSRDGTGNEGVTSNTGEVFTGETDEVHDGLVVCDGALVPAALGVNPFATITALAERSVALVAEARGTEIDYDTKNGSIDLFGKPTKAENIKHEEEGTEMEDECEIEDVAQWSVKAVQCMINDAKANKTEGIGFTEIMSGFIHMDLDEEPVEDFGVASSIAKSGCEAARFFLSVKSWNTDKMVSRGNHSALLTGTFTCSKLPGPLVVHRGGFQLFNNDPRTPDTKNLTYNFEMTDTKHDKYLFNGYKVVNPSVAFNPLKFWKATSTLYVTITRYSDNKVIGRGTLHIQPQDFGSEVVTLQPTGNTIIRKGFSTAQFLTYFVKQSAGLFFAPLNILQWPTATYNGFINNLRPTNTKEIIASDRVKTTLQYWKPLKQSADKKSYEAMSAEEENKAPTILFVPGAAVDHQIFALPTIEKNAVDYFREKGYRIYCVTHRVGKTMSASKGYTAFDARLDIVAALTYITKKHEKQQEGLEEKVYVIAHCAGSVALASGLLDGTIPAKLIKGITASNVFMNPMFARVNMIKASGPIGLNTVYNKLIGSWFNCSSSTNDSYIQQALNQALRFYPVGNTSEICNSVVCHRSSLVFGRLWSHKNLNSATHTQLAHFIGGTSMNSLGHLMHEGKSGYVTGNGPLYTNLVNPLNISRFRDIPIFFIQGTENAVYQPVNTDVSYTTLRDQNGPKNYGRQIFTGYGHLDCWMGDNAHKDIYPTVLYEVDKVMRPRK